MGKLLLSVFAVALGFFPTTEDRMASISINPDPPTQGKAATITYVAGATLIIEYTPGGTVRVVCDAAGKANIVVAAGAQYMLVVDANNSNVSEGYTVNQ